MSDKVYFIKLHTRDHKVEFLVNAAEISTIAGSKENAPAGGTTVTMKGGTDKFNVFEGIERITELLSAVGRMA